jgi:hypothetical protein
MGDSLNALLQGQRAGSVLEGIAHPAVVNPLAAIQAGTQAAQHVYETRGLQAQQALGNILQQSTDENGNVDYQDAQRRAAAAGPVVQMGMQSYLTNNAQLRGAQINQAGAMNGLMAMHGMTLTKDPSDANVNAVFDNLAANGMPADVVARERARVLAMSPADRQNHAYQEGLAHLDQMRQVLGQTTATNVGPRIEATTLNQPAPGSPGGSIVLGNGGVGTGLDPGQSAAYQQWLLAPVEAPDPANPSQMKHYATRGAYFQERGVDPAQVWPGALQGGGAPGAGTPGTQAPAPPGGGPGPSPNKPAKVFGAGSSVSSPSQADLDAQKASTDLFNTSNANAASYQQRIFPIVQAIDLLKSGNVTTGQGADAMNAVKSRLMTVASTFGWDAQSIEQADYDKLSKYTQQYINSQGLSARSDQALASAVTGNPGSHVSTLANKDVWPVLLGMERMNQMINTDFKSQSGKPADFGNFASNWQNTHDPRAFLIDQMDGPQRTKMLASMTNEQKTAYYRTLKLVDQNPGVMLTAPMPGH